MTLLANLGTGSLGLRLQLPAEAEVSRDVVDAAEFRRAADQSRWWLFHHSGMSMDISPTQFDGLQAHAEYYARAMFEETSRTLAEDPAKPLRTTDPSWSPLVDFERIDLDGGPAVRSVHRMVYRAGREMMMGHLLVPLEDGLFEARVLTVDMLTGYRESALMLQFAEQDNVELPELKIDPKRFDDARHDETFEKHCLSRARASLHWLATEGALHIRRPGEHAAEQAEVQIPSERCAVVPPPRLPCLASRRCRDGHGLSTRIVLQHRWRRTTDGAPSPPDPFAGRRLPSVGHCAVGPPLRRRPHETRGAVGHDEGGGNLRIAKGCPRPG